MSLKLTDKSIMPFGKEGIKGVRMEKVPAKYFHWLWHNGIQTAPMDTKPNPHRVAVYEYIRDNMKALQQEDNDLIWKLPS